MCIFEENQQQQGISKVCNCFPHYTPPTFGGRMEKEAANSLEKSNMITHSLNTFLFIFFLSILAKLPCRSSDNAYIGKCRHYDHSVICLPGNLENTYPLFRWHLPLLLLVTSSEGHWFIFKWGYSKLEEKEHYLHLALNMCTSVFQLNTTARGQQKAMREKAVSAGFWLPVAMST